MVVIFYLVCSCYALVNEVVPINKEGGCLVFGDSNKVDEEEEDVVISGVVVIGENKDADDDVFFFMVDDVRTSAVPSSTRWLCNAKVQRLKMLSNAATRCGQRTSVC